MFYIIQILNIESYFEIIKQHISNLGKTRKSFFKKYVESPFIYLFIYFLN